MLVSIKISRTSVFLGSDESRMLFVLHINVKMPTTFFLILTSSGYQKSLKPFILATSYRKKVSDKLHRFESVLNSMLRR